jgi:hypothetical protein
MHVMPPLVRPGSPSAEMEQKWPGILIMLNNQNREIIVFPVGHAKYLQKARTKTILAPLIHPLHPRT